MLRVRGQTLLLGLGLTSGFASSAHAWDPQPICSVDPALTPDDDSFSAAECRAPVDPARIEEIPSLAQAADYLRRARDHVARGELAQAEMELQLVSLAAPSIAERFEVERGEILLRLGENARAKDAFARAVASLDSAVAIRAQIGVVRSSIALGERSARAELDALVRRYPSMPRAAELELSLAQSLLRSGSLDEAARTFRNIDLTWPGGALAAQAREAIAGLQMRGVQIAPFSREERIARAERLVANGALDEAKATLTELLAESPSSVERARLHQIGARIARAEGRTADAEALEANARSSAQAEDATTEPGATALHNPAAAEESAGAARAKQMLRAIAGRRGRAPRATDVLNAIAAGARYGLREDLDRAITSVISRPGIVPELRMELGIWAAGVASDTTLIDVWRGVDSVAARYHLARALERNRQIDEAMSAYQRVVQEDRTEGRYYAMWSRSRLGDLRGASEPITVSSTQLHGPLLASLGDVTDDSVANRAQPETAPVAIAAIVHELRVLATRYGSGAPWIARAADLAELGDLNAAADELHELCVAWRKSRGRSGARSGLIAVYGSNASRVAVASHSRSRAAARAQRSRESVSSPNLRFDDSALEMLGRASRAFGDEGTAILFSGFEEAHPRAYRELVERSAQRYGLDPNLLFAVMRVESVYQRRVVSYAGAIGLMQIMPRTGKLIARRMGLLGFDTGELINPETNIDFAAWYLRSLLERFSGRLPLAIAAYNAGPHNVRKWLRVHPSAMPLDAFLETIPIGQTHRYVRRVLTHYASYRSLSDLPVQQLDTSLPSVGYDPLAF